MRLLNTTIFLLVLGFLAISPQVNASSDERELDSIVVFGAIAISTSYTDPKTIFEELGNLPITAENKSVFKGLPLVGAAVSFTDDNKTHYQNVAYTQDRYVMQTGNLYGVVPLLKGEDKANLRHRMRLPDSLTHLNVK